MKLSNKILTEKDIDGKRIIVTFGDITEEKCDAIVNAANSELIHGGGVAGAIVKKGGKIIQEESNKIGYVPVGNVGVTSAGNLSAKYVIHAVGPRWGEGNEKAKLASAVRNALLKANELNLNSIAMPAISCGIFGFPKEAGTKIIVEEVVNFLRSSSKTIKTVNLCTTDKILAEMFVKHINAI